MQFRNAFLSAMDPTDLAALFPFLKDVALLGGDRLAEAGDPIETVYFPSNCAISILTVMSDGRAVESVSIGYEGAAGLLPALTGVPPTTRMYVQIGGSAISVPAEKLKAQADRSPSLMALILRLAQAGASQAEQSVVCHAAHHLPARLARWLLICQDRVDRPDMTLTQDEMGLMAGALRSSISLTASEFKAQGLIRYSRGRLEIVDRPGLENQACECYHADQIHSLIP
jgi:CRP-like cAMP-binding protein